MEFFSSGGQESWHLIIQQQPFNRKLKDALPGLVGAQYATGDQWKTNSRKNEETEPKKSNIQLWMWLVMEVKSDAVKTSIA